VIAGAIGILAKMAVESRVGIVSPVAIERNLLATKRRRGRRNEKKADDIGERIERTNTEKKNGRKRR